MSFVFRFQNILDFKIGEEERAQKELAEWVSRYNRYTEELSRVTESQQSIKSALLLGNPLNDGPLILKELSLLAEKIRSEIHLIEAPLKEKRENYLEAKKEKETFEILKKKDYQKFIYQQKKKEQKILDEYGRNMYILHKGEE